MTDEGDVGGGVRDANNFYENYAEDTKGKRKVATEEYAAVVAEAARVAEVVNAPGHQAEAVLT